MTRDRPFLVLVVAAAATYPALSLGWCVAALLGTERSAWEMWLAGHPGALAAPVLVLAAAVSVGGAGRVLVRGWWRTRRFRRWAERHRTRPCTTVSAVLTGFPARDRVRVVATDAPLAVTVGAWRPVIVVGDALARELGTVELRAVLAHEHAHVRRRDPLRSLLALVLAAHLWFLPAAAELRGRAWRAQELAADRAAVRRSGRAALAAALLRVTAQVPGAAVSAPFATAELLAARVAQLESGVPPRPAAVSRRCGALTVAGACAFVVAVAGAWTLMVLTCPCW
ncbi:BlaR1 peptidase M56 [Prauserella shujinwangii]|uniref:BlaR1 peptidase M56 n=1 Tax=Prauserella shujinwangii TaxID=1453103 RepID=A0A2T0LKP2_9PSEU|nr:M56 family metallopeptidase [Prauserella shujinwangii]PRX43462.1 BlaR1 peptidase M56 [Prauserella shujinwangii]